VSETGAGEAFSGSGIWRNFAVTNLKFCTLKIQITEKVA